MYNVLMDVYTRSGGYSYTETIETITDSITAADYVNECNNNMDLTPWSDTSKYYTIRIIAPDNKTISSYDID